MDNTTSGAAAGLAESMRKVISSHEAIKAGIATHAEKHEATLEARRRDLAHEQAIEAGAKRNNA
jgi:hypothetical protein